MGVSSIPVGARGSERSRGQLAVLAVARWTCAHWLFVANAGLIVFSTLPFVAPVLAYLGYGEVATLIYNAYSITCHQMPSRSYFILGQQVAYCERCTMIYFSMAFGGLAYIRLRSRRVRPLPWRWYAILILPMAIDGFTQLFGWRESTWLLRGITGTLFGLATIWLAFPTLQESFDQLATDIDAERENAHGTV